MFLINTLGAEVMLRAVLRVLFPFSHVAVFMACGVDELALHLSTCLDGSSPFGGIAEPRPFLTLAPAAGPEAGRSELSCRVVPQAGST